MGDTFTMLVMIGTSETYTKVFFGTLMMSVIIGTSETYTKL